MIDSESTVARQVEARSPTRRHRSEPTILVGGDARGTRPITRKDFSRFQARQAQDD